MAKYIDADKLKESLKKHYTDITVPVITAEGGLESYFRRSEIKDTIKLIDSLQQEPEVDLEKVVEEADNLWESINTGHEYSIIYSKNDFLGICLHMYELGKNSK